jgi:hypothetical protein
VETGITEAGHNATPSLPHQANSATASKRVRLPDRRGRVRDVDLTWEQVVVDAHDPGALGRWWAEPLGWVVVGDAEDEFEIRPTPHRVPGLLFVPVPEEKAGKNRLHPDLLMLLLAGTALSGIPSRALPRWLGWSAAVLAVAFFLSLFSIFSLAEGGGTFGVFFFLGELGLLLWMLVTSVVILRARDVPEPPETPRSSSGPSAPIMPNDDTR